MLWQLQKRTLIPSQLIAYAISLFMGTLILLSTTQLYNDVQPMLVEQGGVLKANTMVINKHVTMFKSMDKSGLYFNEKELDRLRQQDFISDLAPFQHATFKIKAFTEASGKAPAFYTDLFFESIPDKFLDISSEDWKWEEGLDFIPIIIPDSYLKLYNFGFAESQGLPVISESTISAIQFTVRIEGKGETKDFRSKIVGFSSKVNSILVPQNFLTWANANYGSKEETHTSRIFLEIEDSSDEDMLAFFNRYNYNVNEDKLEMGKLTFFFKSALLFVFVIALVLIFSSLSYLILSIQLVLQQNKTLLVNLYSIGYSVKKIAAFYRLFMLGISGLLIIAAVWACSSIRGIYLNKFKQLFSVSDTTNYILIGGAGLFLLLALIYQLILLKNIRKVVGANAPTS